MFRLKGDLERQGYFVLYADALNYVNAAEPIEITDLLIVLAGAFGDALEVEFAGDITRVTCWERLNEFLDTEVNLKEAGVKVEAQTPASKLAGGLKAGVDLKFELKSGTSFRQDLRKVLAARLNNLKHKVDAFFEDGIKLVRNKRGKDT